jgi:hypothetical protein
VKDFEHRMMEDLSEDLDVCGNGCRIFCCVIEGRSVAVAFWISLFWVAFAYQGLEWLQIESAKVANNRE